MKDRFGIDVDVIGVPTNIEGAKDLADRNKFQFEEWAITRIPGMHPNEKQVGDRGVDGRGWFRKPDGYGKIIASVKGGVNINPGMIRDLRGTVEGEKADMGVFIMLDEPSQKTKEAAAVGKFKIGGIEDRSYPKYQIWTIRDYFNGIKPDIPELIENKKAMRQTIERGISTTLV